MPRRTVARSAARGAIASMAMSGLRRITTTLGWLERTPPEAIVADRAPELFHRVPVERRAVLVEAAHLGYGTLGGVAFGLLPAPPPPGLGRPGLRDPAVARVRGGDRPGAGAVPGPTTRAGRPVAGAARRPLALRGSGGGLPVALPRLRRRGLRTAGRSADAGERVADQRVHHPGAAESGAQQHQPGGSRRPGRSPRRRGPADGPTARPVPAPGQRRPPPPPGGPRRRCRAGRCPVARRRRVPLAAPAPCPPPAPPPPRRRPPAR